MSKNTVGAALLAVMLFGGVTAALSHSWYPIECCVGDVDNGDCHPIASCDEITEQKDGSLVWKGITFVPQQIKTTKDQNCHVCVSKSGNGHCIFIRPSS